MRIRVPYSGSGTNETFLEIEGTKFHVDPQATAALYASPLNGPVQEPCGLQKAKNAFPMPVVNALPALGLSLDHLALQYGWPACMWFPSASRTHQDHLFVFHIVGRPTKGSIGEFGNDFRWSFDSPVGNKPCELRIGQSPHPERQHLLTLWVNVPGVPCS